MNNNRPLKSKESLQPIRRGVENSVAPPNSSTRPDDKRVLRFENLEDRRDLAVTGYEGVDHSHVSVDGQEQELTPQLRIWQGSKK